MKNFLLALACLALSAHAAPTAAATPTSTPTSPAIAADPTSINVQYDSVYDNSTLSIDSVACSDGPNGLGTKGDSTLGSVPGFPFIGGAPTVSGWDSANCGNCYAITYGSTTIYVTAVDEAVNSFVLSEQAMDRLTGNQAVALGHVTADYVAAPSASCAAMNSKRDEALYCGALC